MDCKFKDMCGGCSFLDLSKENYEKKKFSDFKEIISHCHQKDFSLDTPFYVDEGTRRRASFTFSITKKSQLFGFNQKASNVIVDIDNCLVLTKKINDNLLDIKNLIIEICKTPVVEKIKKGKVKTSYIQTGDILVCEAENGLDIVFEFEQELSLDHKFIISDFLQKNSDIIRISHRQSTFGKCETIAEKVKPYIDISGIKVFISAGTFLQASKKGETKLIETVLKYIGSDTGNIADLFCGIGTFSYPLSSNKRNKIIAIDSSPDLLEGFKDSINKNMITNIHIEKKNLFKYPLDADELKNIDIIIMDPPRAGAFEQTQKIVEAQNVKKVIYVSCNPNSFVRDANLLINSQYNLEEITFVDQFTYSNHYELVAIFTKKDNNP